MTALATVEDVEAVIGRDIASDDIPRVSRLLELCSGVVRRECGQTISHVAGDELTIAGTYEPELWLPQRPVTALTSVTIDGVTLPPSSYQWSRQGRLYRTSYDREILDWRTWGAWGSSDSAVVVIYDHGYPAADVPDDIVMIVAEMVVVRISNPEQIRSETVEDYSVSYAIPINSQPLSFGLTDAHRDVLAKFFPPITSVPITTDAGCW